MIIKTQLELWLTKKDHIYIKQQLKQRGVNVKVLGEALKISTSTLYRMLAGEIPANTLIELLSKYDIKITLTPLENNPIG